MISRIPSEILNPNHSAADKFSYPEWSDILQLSQQFSILPMWPIGVELHHFLPWHTEVVGSIHGAVNRRVFLHFFFRDPGAE